MVITCEKCGKSFKFDEKLIKPEGSKVKCSACGLIFRVFPPSAAAAGKGASPEVELIICDNCGTGFNMKQSLLQPDGTKVRCSKCKNVFIAFPSFTAAEPESTAGVVSPPEPPSPPEKPEPAAEEKDTTAPEVTAEEPGGVSEDEQDMNFSLEEEEDLSLDDEDLSLDDEDLDLEEDEELDLDLDLDEEPAADPEEEAADDLDLDLDLEEAGLEEEDSVPDESSGDFELELAEDTIQVETQEEPSGDLDIELDLDEDEEESAGGDEEELDFSEVDSLLESDDVSVADTVEMATDDLELDLDADDSMDSIEQQEIDLADLEQTIEMELLEPDEEGDEEENEDVELELADDVGGDDLDEEITLDEDEEEDFSDIERMLEAGDDEEGEGDISLDFESDEAEAAAAAEPAGKAKKSKKKEKKPKKEKKARKEKKPAEGGRKSSRIVLVILIILLLLAALGGGAYYLTTSMGVKIPFIEAIIGPAGEQSPAGDVKVMQSTIESDFVTNTEAGGKLFIIKGTVKNDSLKPRKHILVQTRMYSQGHTLEATEAAYCGNILSPEELADSSLDAIQTRLAKKAGDNNRNLAVKPGDTIPFMIVVPKLPENLVEYEVLVAESAPVE